jgi:hypothetical protein
MSRRGFAGRAVRWVLASIGTGLTAYGHTLAAVHVLPDPPPLAGPPPGHPEQVCPEQPLSLLEAALAEDLARIGPVRPRPAPRDPSDRP